MASLDEYLVSHFRRLDSKQDGTVLKSIVYNIFQKLDPDTFSNQNLALVLDECAVGNDTIRYMDFVRWLMSGADVSKQCSPVCQAALEGSVEDLERIFSCEGPDALRKPGYVLVNGVIMGLRGVGLVPLSEHPTMEPMAAFHYAAIKGHAAALSYLHQTCSVHEAMGENPLSTEKFMAGNWIKATPHSQEGGTGGTDEAPLSPSSIAGWSEKVSQGSRPSVSFLGVAEEFEPEDCVLTSTVDNSPTRQRIIDGSVYHTSPPQEVKKLLDTAFAEIYFCSEGLSSNDDSEPPASNHGKRTTSTHVTAIPKPEELGIWVCRKQERANSF